MLMSSASKRLTWKRDDGGRAKAGYTGDAGDCVCRAIAICANRPYQEVYDRLAKGNAEQRKSKYRTKRYAKSARNGIYTGRVWFNRYMEELGFVWHPCMQIGTGCKVHLRDGEIPMKGRIIVSLSRHLCAVIDGVIHDTYDPSRDGYRCVYGYWEYKPQSSFDTEIHQVRLKPPPMITSVIHPTPPAIIAKPNVSMAKPDIRVETLVKGLISLRNILGAMNDKLNVLIETFNENA